MMQAGRPEVVGLELVSACFICDRPTREVLVVTRIDGTAYDVPMCAGCASRARQREQPIHFAHELIDARNDYRAIKPARVA